MNAKRKKPNCRLFVFAAAVAVVIFSFSPVTLAYVQPVAPIPVKILMLIPDDFDQYSYTSFIKETEIRHHFGKEAEEQFKNLLVPVFRSMVMEPIITEAAARDLLSPDSPGNARVREYDYVAIPKFNNVNSWHKRLHYRYEVEILIEFYAADGSNITKAKGYGESTTGIYASTTPRDAANVALTGAVEVIRDGLEQRKGLFAVIPPPVAVLAPVVTSLSGEDTMPGVTPLPAKILLLIPEEFDRFVYTGSIEGTETRHALGEEAQKQFGRLLVPEFQSVVIKSVSSETAALDMISPDNMDKIGTQEYDYIAIPRFADVSSWWKSSGYGFEIDVVLEFYSTGKARDVKIKGYGEFSTGRDSFTPIEAGRRALKSAIRAISEDIDRRRDLFTS